MRTIALIAAGLCLAACTMTAPHGRSAVDLPASRSSILTGREMAELYERGSLLEAMRNLRPHFINPRGWKPPVVYVDGVELNNGLQALGSIPVEQVEQVQYLSSIEATTRFGSGHNSGALIVSLAYRSGPVRLHNDGLVETRAFR